MLLFYIFWYRKEGEKEGREKRKKEKKGRKKNVLKMVYCGLFFYVVVILKELIMYLILSLWKFKNFVFVLG